MRSTARACFRRPKIGEFCAHTCPEDGDASKPAGARRADLRRHRAMRLARKGEGRTLRSTEAEPPGVQDRPRVGRVLHVWGSQKQNTRKIVLKKK